MDIKLIDNMVPRLKYTSWIFFIQYLLLTSALGCSNPESFPEEDKNTTTPGINNGNFVFSKNNLEYEWAGGMKNISVTTSFSNWNCQTDGSDWCTATKNSDKSLSVSVAKNTGEQRTSQVILFNDKKTHSDTLFITQFSNKTEVQKDILSENTNYTVEVFKNGEWVKKYVYSALVSDYVGNPEAGYTQYTMGFSMFTDSFDEPLKIRVTNKKSFSKVEIRPLSYNILPSSQTSNTVEFALTEPGKKISLEFDGNRMENLFILPDLPDNDIPSGSNVTYYGPGVHNVGLISVKNTNGQIIYIDEGAVVLGRVKAENANNLTIRGRGILCSSQENHGTGRLPQLDFLNCHNLKIEGLMLRDSPNWTIKIVGSTGVHINNIKEIGWIMNSDGMDFICCRNVLVENTFQRNYDDNITIKAFNAKPEYIASHTNTDGSYSDGSIWTVIALQNFDVYDYEIRNCVFWADKAHNMLVGPESRGISFKNIHFHNNIVLENRQNDATYPGCMAIMIADNGTFEDITFEDIIVEDINGGKVFCTHFTNAWAQDNLYGQWAKNITLNNIIYNGTRATKSWIRGRSSTQFIDGVSVSGFYVNGSPVTNGSGPYLEINAHVKNVIFK
ncbi:MAG: glycosyl hydrolase family 28 protein [Bacteroidales bacterium]